MTKVNWDVVDNNDSESGVNEAVVPILNRSISVSFLIIPWHPIILHGVHPRNS